MDRYKKRLGSCFRRVNGEGDSGDAEAIKDQIPWIWDLVFLLQSVMYRMEMDLDYSTDKP